ncbi:hypothetical protein Tco_1457199 [Tanacetum coccineum]
MLKTERSRQKSYADKRRKPIEFKVGDRVLLKVSPWKGVIDENLHFIEEPIEIVAWDVKKLKRRRIPLIKVPLIKSESKENQFKTKYPHLFASTSSAPVAS